MQKYMVGWSDEMEEAINNVELYPGACYSGEFFLFEATDSLQAGNMFFDFYIPNMIKYDPQIYKECKEMVIEWMIENTINGDVERFPERFRSLFEQIWNLVEEYKEKAKNETEVKDSDKAMLGFILSKIDIDKIIYYLTEDEVDKLLREYWYYMIVAVPLTDVVPKTDKNNEGEIEDIVEESWLK